jgi:ComF family protein
MLPSASLGDECVRCRRTIAIAGAEPAIDIGRAAGIYTGALRAIIHAFKYRRRRSLATPLAQLMRQHGEALIEDVDWVVPVPLHRTRARQRGFNQADDLARALRLPTLHALRRVRATRPQSDLPAARRNRNVRDAFALPRLRTRRVARTLAGRCVILVDDVSTTGATLNACARVLKTAGAREVRALTAARAVRTPRGESPPRRLPSTVRR